MDSQMLLQAQQLLDRGNTKAALHLYEELIKNEPENALAYQNAAIIEGELGNDEKALTLSQKALELMDNLVIPHVTRAYVFDRIGRTEESRKEAKIAVEKDPQSPEALACLGVLSMIDKKVDDAKRYLDKATKIRPSFYFAHYNLAAVYQNTRELKNFARQAVILFQMKPNAENFLRLTYIFSRSYRLVYVVVLLLTIFISLMIGPELILLSTFLLIFIDLLGGVFIGIKAERKPLQQFIINLMLSLGTALLGVVVYLLFRLLVER